MLELTVARELYERHPDFSEGRMTKIRAHVVSRASCAAVARELELGRRLYERAPELAGDEAKPLSRNRNVLAALLEASIATLFLEHGFEAVEPAVVAAFSGQIEYALTSPVDPKTELQEELARRGLKASYTVVEVDGPAHDRRFTCAVAIDGEESGVGRGSSKKEAEQQAALQAFEAIGLAHRAAV